MNLFTTLAASLIIFIILAVWLYGAVYYSILARKEAGWEKVGLYLGSLLMAVGAIGFFGAALSSGGALDWLPESFEWPVGSAEGVVSTKDHFFAVPLSASGRVQVYDGNWKFVRGWRVNACGGNFRLFITDGNHIHVVTYRGAWHYVFELSGQLLSQSNYPAGTSDSFPKEGYSCTVPTPFWLWVFTGPFYSWIAAALGVALLAASTKKETKGETNQGGND